MAKNPRKKRVQKAYTPDQVIAIIKGRHDAPESLRQIAASYDNITFGDIGRLLQDPPVFPRSPKKLKALGMRPQVLAPACPSCGGAHPITHPREQNYQDLFAMPVEVLRWKLENRESV